MATTTLALVTSTIETLEEQARTIAVLHLGANQAEALRGAEEAAVVLVSPAEAATAHPVALAMATRQLALRTVTGATPSAPLHERRIAGSSPVCCPP